MRESREAEIRVYGADVLASPQFQTARTQIHHHTSTVAAHSMKVAMVSVAICSFLGKMHVKTDRRDVVLGALCHDFGILGRYDKFRNSRECCHQHPIDSVEEAMKVVPDLDEKTRKIIRYHMFPMTIHPPVSLEGVVVSVADKVASVGDGVSYMRQKLSGRAAG